MSDLVQRLRNRIHDAPMPSEHMMDEAADRIEALEAALRFALEVMENYSKLDGRDPSYATPSSAIGVARAALAPEQTNE